MALQLFNEGFIPEGSNDPIHAKSALPSNPATFVRDFSMQNALEGYQGSKLLGDAYEYFMQGVLATRIHTGVYNKGTESKSRYYSQVSTTTVDPTFFQLLKHLVPQLSETATLVNRGADDESARNQYSMTMYCKAGDVSKPGSAVGDLINRHDQACQTVERIAYEDTAPDERYWALLAGIVAGNRGGFRLVNPTEEHDPAGDIRVQFDFKTGDIFDKLFSKAGQSPNFWNRTDREGSTRLELRGKNAYDFIVKLNSVCPILAYTNPEIILMLAYGVNEGLDRIALYKAYCEVKAISENEDESAGQF